MATTTAQNCPRHSRENRVLTHPAGQGSDAVTIPDQIKSLLAQQAREDIEQLGRAQTGGPNVQTCFDCRQEIHAPIVWLGEDHGSHGRVVYAFHCDCSLGAWPLFELSDVQAREWIKDGAHTNAQ